MSQKLIDLILYENENTNLDFKKTEYRKENYDELLKDFIAFANAKSDETKYIIIGVKLFDDGKRLFHNIESLTDEAVFQQLVLSNIEPEIEFKYYPFNHDNCTFGVFEINKTLNKPYMMKKARGKNLEGHSFIRKGSTTKNLCRADLDYIYDNNKVDISSDIFISLDNTEIITNKEIILSTPEPPSYLRKVEIEKLLKSKQFENSNPINHVYKIPSWMKNYDGFESDEDKSVDTLKKELEDVEYDYSNEDNYYFNEKIAEKLNFYINNKSLEYLEDVTIEIEIPFSMNYRILEDKHPELITSNGFNLNISKPLDYERFNYPKVNVTKESYKLRIDIGTVKQHLSEKIIKVPLRMIIDFYCEFYLVVNFKIYSKNLKKPVEKEIKVKYIYNPQAL